MDCQRTRCREVYTSACVYIKFKSRSAVIEERTDIVGHWIGYTRGMNVHAMFMNYVRIYVLVVELRYRCNVRYRTYRYYTYLVCTVHTIQQLLNTRQ